MICINCGKTMSEREWKINPTNPLCLKCMKLLKLELQKAVDMEKEDPTCKNV